MTLPLSYSRTSPLRADVHRERPGTVLRYFSSALLSNIVLSRRPRSAPLSGRELVAREGFEPSKPQGRQIYSLLRLTASLPRQ